MEQGFIKNIIIIGVILGVAFFSQLFSPLDWVKNQQGSLLGKGKIFTFIYDAVDYTQAYLAKGSAWLTDKVFPNIVGEAQKRGEMVKDEVVKEKEKISESVGEKIKNYFSGIADSILHPGENNNNCDCQTQPAQTQTWYQSQ